ncbi:hypothetical protein [Neolewinella antarctica]|uniref:Preprotein translocase subunit YajC n=1 Tax=Neolewinella antarctica TaxID=442734 RepID=A0ABX0XGL7_9BACT|nr:hypothetical protein [Neolewinella antarctica]NJC28479.1 preprotein translocase subunit YajC [Neolewinella antarctica]
MKTSQPRSFLLAAMIMFVLSGLSFGFLLGQSHQQRTVEATEQIRAMSSQVKTGGALVARVALSVRNVLIK